jgi:uncharacterized membrane protein YeaQ/YmgE (transglycosylase-associated protein family)
MTISQLVVWLILGLLTGALVGVFFPQPANIYGRMKTLAIGMVGALIGGYLGRALNIDLGLAAIAISLRDVVFAFLGALLFLAVIGCLRRYCCKCGSCTTGEKR